MSRLFSQKPLILGSGSKSRASLLSSLQLDFKIVPSNFDEDLEKKAFQSKHLSNLAQHLARGKALEVSNRYPDYYVIGADQLCIFKDTYLDKPLNHERAIEQLSLLNGNQHQQLSAYCIAKEGEILWEDQDSATLFMNNLNPKIIQSYIENEQPYQSAGAYHFEGQAKWLFAQVIGSDSTILGLPLLSLTNALIQLGVVTF